MSFSIVIPARVESTRFPAKLSVRVAGKPLLAQTVHAARAVRGENGLPVPVYVATDDILLADIAYEAGATPVLTSSRPTNGTERVAEVAEALKLRGVIVNLQGDSPLVKPEHIITVVRARQGLNRTISTLCFPSPASERRGDDPGRVTVVHDNKWRARHFQRSSPTYLKPDETEYLHCGVYAFDAHDLISYAQNGACSWEQREGLEQLRWTWMGYDVACPAIRHETLPPEVNYPEDLDRVREAFAKRPEPLYMTTEKTDG